MPPLTPKQTGKPPANHKEADRWLKDEIVWGDGTKYKLDDKDINWWHSLAPGGYADGGPSLPAFGMVRLLADSYVDCGDPKVLTDFLKWGMKKYPAKHYLVDVWNHGGGWENLPAETNRVDELASQRLRVLKQLSGTEPPRCVLTTMQALIQPVPNRAQLEQNRRVLRSQVERLAAQVRLPK